MTGSNFTVYACVLVGRNVGRVRMQAEVSIGSFARLVAIAKAIATMVVQQRERCQCRLLGFEAHHIVAAR